MTDIEKALISRVGSLIRGDWSGTVFDGRDIRDILDMIVVGKIETAEKMLSRYEEYYK